MKIEDQVCSLDQARELHELGVRCESYFGWVKSSNGKDWYISSDDIDFADYYAYTCAELGVMLPSEIKNDAYEDDDYFLNIYNFGHNERILSNNGWQIVYVSNDNLLLSQNGKTEAQARASALIWLIKSGHIKAEEVKL